MPSNALSAPAQQSESSTKLAIVVALGAERSALSDVSCGDMDCIIIQSGPGAANAARAAEKALRDGATALLSVGIAGALSEELVAGSVLVPRYLIDAETPQHPMQTAETWSGELRALLAPDFHVSDGTLLGVAGVIGEPAARRAARQQYQAVACDMESAAMAHVAARAKVQFAAIRVISDQAKDTLPAGVDAWVDSDGNSTILPVLFALLAPSQWLSFIVMVRRFRIAHATLSRVCRMLRNVGYCCSRT